MNYYISFIYFFVFLILPINETKINKRKEKKKGLEGVTHSSSPPSDKTPNKNENTSLPTVNPKPWPPAIQFRNLFPSFPWQSSKKLPSFVPHSFFSFLSSLCWCDWSLIWWGKGRGGAWWRGSFVWRRCGAFFSHRRWAVAVLLLLLFRVCTLLRATDCNA